MAEPAPDRAEAPDEPDVNRAPDHATATKSG
jgi:hypothetical protein